MTNQLPVLGQAAVLLTLLFGIGGCAHQSVKKTVMSESSPSTAMTSMAVPPVSVESAEPSVRSDIMQSIPELQTVRFDYDSSFLKPQVRETLVKNAQWLKSHQDARVQVTGNCDQRGTVEYNLALGQRRATAVRQYYIYLGIPGNRIATISYGKERLLCQASNETCWQKNRRGETLKAVSQNVAAVSTHPAAQ